MDEQRVNAAIAAFKRQLDERFGTKTVLPRKQVEQEFRKFITAFLIGYQSPSAPGATEPVPAQAPAAEAGSTEQVLWEGRPQWTWDWFTNQFEFDSFELRIKTGFLSRDLEKIPLKRIQDISLQQTFWERLLNIGRISITTSDASAPIVVLFAIAYPDFVLKQLQEAVRNARQAAGVRLREDV